MPKQVVNQPENVHRNEAVPLENCQPNQIENENMEPAPQHEKCLFDFPFLKLKTNLWKGKMPKSKTPK